MMGDLSDAEVAMRWARAMVRFIARLWWAIWIGPEMRRDGEVD